MHGPDEKGVKILMVLIEQTMTLDGGDSDDDGDERMMREGRRAAGGEKAGSGCIRARCDSPSPAPRLCRHATNTTHFARSIGAK